VSTPSTSEEINHLIEARSRSYGDRAKSEAASIALARARHAAAVAFGAPYGWRPAIKGFGLGELAPRRRDGIFRAWHDPKWPALDHRTCFRRRRSPAAIVAQPYAPAFSCEEAQAFADEHGLRVEVVDEPGWYAPGKCVVVVWTRAA
jgi:hypothetical protein